MSLVKNSLWNLSGYIIPFIVSIPSIGYIARCLGTEQFGLYTLCIAVVGYAGIFDAGISRAVVREISIYRNDRNERNDIITSSLFLLMILGVMGGGGLSLFSDNIISLLNISEENVHVMVRSIYIISFALPIFLLTQVILANLEGQEKFRKLNIIKSTNSSLISLLPAVFLFFFEYKTIDVAILGLLAARLVSLILTITFCYLKEDVNLSKFKVNIIKRLISFGGWLTITNIISPMMTYFDRFILSHIMGAHQVALYTAPSEAVSKLLVIPNALSRAIFPKLSSVDNEAEKAKFEILGYKLMLLMSLPIFIFVFIFSDRILTLWMGAEFSGFPSEVFRILLVGFVFNACAQIPYSSLQASGYSNITAYIHIIELVPYITFLFFCINKFGVIGAAIAWSSRMVLDLLILFILNKKIIREF